MNHIKEIARRLKGLRESVELSCEEMAALTGIGKEQYESYESGECDIPVSFLYEMGEKMGVELSALLFGEEPRMATYYVTRAGKGPAVERTSAYRYQALASGFQRRKFTPLMVTVEPDDNREMTFNSHPGQEYDYVVEGTLEVVVDGHRIVLHEGDCVMYDSTRPHGMRALDGKPVKFLAVIS